MKALGGIRSTALAALIAVAPGVIHAAGSTNSRTNSVFDILGDAAQLTQITPGDRDWVDSLFGREATDTEILQVLREWEHIIKLYPVNIQELPDGGNQDPNAEKRMQLLQTFVARVK